MIWHSNSLRDGRYGVLRSASFSIDEHRGKEQYNHMSGRNIYHSGLSVDGAPPGTDCGIRMLSGGDIMGIARPGFQGNFPSAILNSGSMLSSSAEAMPSQVNLHSGVGSAQGNLMLRPRDALNMMRVSYLLFSISRLGKCHRKPFIVTSDQVFV